MVVARMRYDAATLGGGRMGSEISDHSYAVAYFIDRHKSKHS